MNKKKLARDELTGRYVRIKACPDPTWVNKSGIVLDETKNTFVLEINNKEKRIAKKNTTFEFDINGKRMELNGSRVLYRPQDRIKKVR